MEQQSYLLGFFCLVGWLVFFTNGFECIIHEQLFYISGNVPNFTDPFRKKTVCLVLWRYRKIEHCKIFSHRWQGNVNYWTSIRVTSVRVSERLLLLSCYCNVAINLQQALTGWNLRLASKAEQLISRNGYSVTCLGWAALSWAHGWQHSLQQALQPRERERSEGARGPRASSCPSRNQASLRALWEKGFFFPLRNFSSGKENLSNNYSLYIFISCWK